MAKLLFLKSSVCLFCLQGTQNDEKNFFNDAGYPISSDENKHSSSSNGFCWKSITYGRKGYVESKWRQMGALLKPVFKPFFVPTEKFVPT
jgi:hypothetical protein